MLPIRVLEEENLAFLQLITIPRELGTGFLGSFFSQLHHKMLKFHGESINFCELQARPNERSLTAT